MSLACRRQDRLVWQAIRQVVLHEANQLDVPQSEAQQLLAQVGGAMPHCAPILYCAVELVVPTLSSIKGFQPMCRHLRLWKTANLLQTRSCADVQIQGGRSAQQQALRAAVLSMFADNQAAAQRKPLLSSIGISVPPPHNILRHIRSQLRHQAVRLGLTVAERAYKHLHVARFGSRLRSVHSRCLGTRKWALADSQELIMLWGCLCRSAVETNLRQLAAENPALSVQLLPALGASAAAWQLSVADTRLLVILTNGQLRLEHYDQAAEQEQGQQWVAEEAGTISTRQLQVAIYDLCRSKG